MVGGYKHGPTYLNALTVEKSFADTMATTAKMALTICTTRTAMSDRVPGVPVRTARGFGGACCAPASIPIACIAYCRSSNQNCCA